MTCHSEKYDLTSCHWLKLRSLASFEARIDFLPFTSSSSSFSWSPSASPSPTISSRSSVCVDFTAWLPLQLIPRPNRSWKNEGKMRKTTPIQTNPPSQLHSSQQGVPKKWSQRSDNIRWIIVWASMSKYTLDTRSALVHCKHKVLWYHSPGIIASPSAKQRSIWESWWLRRRVRSNDNIGPGSGMEESALRTKCAKLIWKVFMKMSLCLLCLCELFCVCIW